MNDGRGASGWRETAPIGLLDTANLQKSGYSEGYDDKTIPTAVQFGYDRHEFEGYLGNVGV